MSCQTSQKVSILSISNISVHVMTFCLNVLPEALPAGQELRSTIIKGWLHVDQEKCIFFILGGYQQ